MNAVSADQMMASYALTPDSAKSKALESWHPAAGTVTDMAGDDTVQTDTAVRTNTMVGAGHDRRSRRDTSAGCRANPIHQRQVGVCSSLWSGRREGASKTLIMCRTTEAGHWGIQQIRTFTTMQVIIDKSPSADRYRNLVCEGQVGRLMVVPDSGEYAPFVAESIEDSYVLWDIKAVTVGPSTLLLA